LIFIISILVFFDKTNSFCQEKTWISIHKDARLDEDVRKKETGRDADKKGIRAEKDSKNKKNNKKETKIPPKKKPPVLAASRGGHYVGKGFRVQIYSGTERHTAENIKNEFSKRYPNVACFLTYTSPQYRVRVGNYKSKADARSMFNEASGSYYPCMIVPDYIVIK